MSWTFIGMLLVIGLIAANLALLKHGSKKQKIATEKKEQLPPPLSASGNSNSAGSGIRSSGPTSRLSS